MLFRSRAKTVPKQGLKRKDPLPATDVDLEDQFDLTSKPNTRSTQQGTSSSSTAAPAHLPTTSAADEDDSESDEENDLDSDDALYIDEADWSRLSGEARAC